MKPCRRCVRLLTSLFALLALTSVFAPIPAGAAEQLAPPEDTVVAVDPASEPYELPAVTLPLSEEQSLPLIDLSELEGIWPQDIVEVIPGKTDATSPTDAVAGAEALPAEGGASLDAFGFGEGAANHIALIYPEDLNAQKPNGDWTDVALTLSVTDAGWRFTDPAGSRIDLPSELSGTTPVTFTTAAGGVFTLAPASGTTSKGEASGASVTYPGAFEGADLIYTLAPGGLQERIVLAAPVGASTFSFTTGAQDLKLAPNLHGGIDVLDAGGAAVATLPAPVAYDASPEPASSVGSYALTGAGPGTMNLEVAMDRGWLAAATYPVVIDPTWDDITNRDGYTDQSSPATSFESDTYLQVDSGKRTYVRFGASQIEASEQIVYGAQMFLYQSATGGVAGGIDAKRVMGTWPASGTLSWNDQPAIGTTVFDNTATANGGGGFWYWDVTELYQHYLDTSSTYNTPWTDHGVALTASNPKTFHAVDSTLQNTDPALYVTYNRLPYAPALDGPVANYVSETESLTLSANQIPGDPNGDDVMVSFQISDDGITWTGTNLVFQSPYDDSKSFTVPSGVLLDGQT